MIEWAPSNGLSPYFLIMTFSVINSPYQFTLYFLFLKNFLMDNQLCFSRFCPIKSSFNDISYLDNVIWFAQLFLIRFHHWIGLQKLPQIDPWHAEIHPIYTKIQWFLLHVSLFLQKLCWFHLTIGWAFKNFPKLLVNFGQVLTWKFSFFELKYVLVPHQIIWRHHMKAEKYLGGFKAKKWPSKELPEKSYGPYNFKLLMKFWPLSQFYCRGQICTFNMSAFEAKAENPKKNSGL